VLWLWIIAAIVLILVLASLGRKAKQRAALAELREQFPRIARLRLVAACPGLDGTLRDTELRLLFDWILIELYGRTRSSDIAGLMRWSIDHGESETTRLTAEVTREAVELLPRPVLAIIDECGGRTVAAVLLDQALTEAGQRVAPRLDR